MWRRFSMAQQVEVYLQLDQCSLVKKRRVQIKDVAKVYSTDAVLAQKIGELEIWVFSGKKEKKAFSALKVLEIIGAKHPEATVTPLGEIDFIVEYEPKKEGKKNNPAEMIKVVFVCLTSFFGSAFTIMTFNKDAAVEEVFALIYKLTKGAEVTTPAELEIAYSIGLPIGIILFFNHFLRKKIDSDPTPLQVQMREYEKSVNTTIIENAAREGKKEDV